MDIEQIELLKKGGTGTLEIKNKILFKKKRNPRKRALTVENILIDNMNVEVKKVSFWVCKQPKTYKLIPCNWTEEEREAYKASHYDEKGKFKFDPAPDYTILQGQQNRQ